VQVGVPGAEVVEMVKVVHTQLEAWVLAVPNMPNMLLVLLILLVLLLPQDNGGVILDIACFVYHGGCKQHASNKSR
jgi:hypothetical protein